jgi:hypothetical protein
MHEGEGVLWAQEIEVGAHHDRELDGDVQRA